MKKTTMIGIVLAALLVPLAASAYWGHGYGANHEEMEEILEEGTYQDLVDYRQKTGFNTMPWVDSDEDFEYAKERHEVMEEHHEQMPCHGGFGRGFGMGHGWR